MCWHNAFYPEPGLPDPGPEVTTGSKFVAKGRQLGGSFHVKPCRIDLAKVVARVEHGESVNLKLRFCWGRQQRRRLLNLTSERLLLLRVERGYFDNARGRIGTAL